MTFDMGKLRRYTGIGSDPAAVGRFGESLADRRGSSDRDRPGVCAVLLMGVGRASAARMMLLMQLFESLAGNVGVDLRGRQIAVAEEHLHHP